MAYVRHVRTDPGAGTPPHETIYTAPEMREARGAAPERSEREERVTTGMLAGGASTEVLAGAAAVALSIIGLAGGAPVILGAISAIAVGGALILFSGALAARWNQIGHRIRAEREEGVDVLGGMGTEAMGGAAGVVLGILALVGVAPVPLLSIATICLGGGVLFGGAGQAELDVLSYDADPDRDRWTRRAVRASGGGMALAGAGAVVLGILGIIGVTPALTLALVATLVLGGGLVLGGSAGTLRFGTGLRHRKA